MRGTAKDTLKRISRRHGHDSVEIFFEASGSVGGNNCDCSGEPRMQNRLWAVLSASDARLAPTEATAERRGLRPE